MKFTTGKYFLDTNFLIYCFSDSEKEKRKKCREILHRGRDDIEFVLSIQVLKEFTAVMITKFKVDPRIIKQILVDLSRFEVFQVNTEAILKAIDIHLLYNYSFWDSLVIVSAIECKCVGLLSEDLHSGHQISGLKIMDPFGLE